MKIYFSSNKFNKKNEEKEEEKNHFLTIKRIENNFFKSFF